jgi:hypothetical protein
VNAGQRARLQARQAATQARPIASSAKVTAGDRIVRVRAWAAPRIESSGHTLEERVAPKVSSMLSSAAKRIDPVRRRRRRWPFLLVGVVVLGAAAGAVLNRRSSTAPWRKGEQQDSNAAVSDATPEAAPSTSTNGAAKAKARAS